MSWWKSFFVRSQLDSELRFHIDQPALNLV
jgi:hypothetical protein